MRLSIKPAIILISLVVLYLLPILYHGLIDQEIYQLGTFSSVYYYNHIINCEIPFWINNYGFGVPFPIGQAQTFHPIYLLSIILPIQHVYGLVWVFHLFFGVLFLFKTINLLTFKRSYAYFGVILFLLSSPSFDYIYFNDWPNVFIAWSMLPVLLWLLIKIYLCNQNIELFIYSLALTIVISLLGINCHYGYLICVFIAFFILTLLLIFLDPKKIFVLLIVGGGVALLANSEKIYFVLTEAEFFPKSYSHIALDGYSVRDYIQQAILPISSKNYLQPFNYISTPLERVPLLGIAPTVASILLFIFIFHNDKIHNSKYHRIYVAIGIIFWISILFSLQKHEFLFGVSSGVWLFRDAAILFGIVSVCIMMALIGDKRIITSLILIQIVQLSLFAYPIFKNSTKGDWVALEKSPEKSNFIQWLKINGVQINDRLYLSPKIEKQIRKNLKAEGIFGITDLVIAGYNPVNGWFKGISMDHFYPSISKFHGRISGENHVIENKKLIEISSIEYIIISKIEYDSLKQLPELIRVSSYKTTTGSNILLLKNNSAWRLIEPIANTETCKADGYDCRPFINNCGSEHIDNLYACKKKGLIEINIGDINQVSVKILDERDPPENRLYFIGLNVRKDTKIIDQDSQELSKLRSIGGFTIVETKPETSEFNIIFTTRLRVVLYWVSNVTIFFCMSLLGVLMIRRHSSRHIKIDKRMPVV